MAFVNKEYLLKAFDAFNDAEHAPKGWISAMNTAREIVEDAPMICTGMFGRWLAYDENGEPTEGEAAFLQCSNCLNREDGRRKRRMNFCPTCGAFMREVL